MPLNDTGRRLRDVRAGTVAKVASLSRQFDEIVFAATDVATDDEHDPEGHTIAWERQQIAALLARARADLVAIETALLRFEEGRHGRCLNCGGRIALARLEVLPEVETCISCAP